MTTVPPTDPNMPARPAPPSTARSGSIPPSTGSAPPPQSDPALVASLRADLEAAGFTVDELTELLGPAAARALRREQRLPADLATREDGSPAATLVRLFALGLPVGTTRLAAALPRLGVEGLVRLGLATVDGDGDGDDDGDGDGASVHAICDLRPYADEQHSWWVASDLSEIAVRGPLPADHVLGIGGASTTLASWTPRPRVDSALDLGTGSGVQALHLASHARRVVATDVSARALRYASFNAELAGLDLDLRLGDMLAPVRGERFGLVVSNPPFVITPRLSDVMRYEYRDGGLAGDEVVAELVRNLGDHLEPGGIAQLLGNWELPAGGDWRARVGGWLEGTGLDAWVIQREVQDPAEYAETWARDGGQRPGTEEFERLYAVWLADFAARDVASIGFGVVTLQRPATDREPWRDLAEVLGPVAAPMGPAVLAGVRARTWLAEHGDRGALETAWRCADDVTEERHGRPGAEDPNVILIRQGGGLRRVVRADTVLAAFIGVCDGELTAGRALVAIATLVGESSDTVRDRALPRIRELVADGLLLR
jgi:hypothetical protein